MKINTIGNTKLCNDLESMISIENNNTKDLF